MSRPALATVPLAAIATDPTAGRGLLPRPRLVRRLVDAADVPVVAIVAPAGYGKTTTLLEWASHDEREVMWIALGAGGDSRPLTAIARSLEESDLGVTPLFASGRPPRRPFVLVVDDLHLLPAGEATAALTSIANRVPEGSQLILASRTEPPLPIGRMRAHRRILELHARDLAMTRAEAALVMRLAGPRLSDEELATLVARTEGWPVALSLAARSLLDEPDVGAAVERFGGGDRIVSDYLRDEVLSHVPHMLVRFLLRTSILEELSGPVCDAVLLRRGSGAVLQGLARAHVPLIALDRSDATYRHHRLFAEMLRGELRRLEPENEAELHRAAAAWYEVLGDIERALDHATSAGDIRHAGALLWSIAPQEVFQGRDAAVARRLDQFTHEQLEAHGSLALVAATTQFVTARGDRAEHWLSAAADDVAAESYVTILRAALGAGGIVRTRTDAARAYEGLPETSPWRAVCCLLMGVAEHLTGDPERAVEHLREGCRRGAIVAPSIRSLCFAQIALAAFERGDVDEAATAASRARAEAEHSALLHQPTSALVLAVSALARARQGRAPETAHHEMRLALDHLARFEDCAPWYEAETRIALARAALRLSDAGAAKTLLAAASASVSRTADAVALRAWLQDARADLDRFLTISVVEPTSLTGAELRVLPLLPTHLPFREIGRRLHVSETTVKTHANAIYRKLDASSRSEAVVRARDLALIDADTIA